jgi:hypothetical protein
MTETHLIKVLTITPKMLKQVRILHAYSNGTNEQGLMKAIWKALGSEALKPICWINGKNLPEGMAPPGEFWLIQVGLAANVYNENPGLFLVPAPEKGSDPWKLHQPIPQLFV